VLRSNGCHAVLINSVSDHVHNLFELARTASVSEVVEDWKAASSKWIKTQVGVEPKFAWQAGYGVFSVSASNVDAVKDYIANQARHHRRRTFEDEFRGLLEKHGIPYDERYVWD
jgi:REP element-mobilizing transposase RayT